MQSLPVVVLFLLFCSQVSATQFYTERGELCISECEMNGRSYYWCWTGTHVWSWGYCSPTPMTNRFGARCSGPCDYSLFSNTKKCRNRYSAWSEYCGTHRGNFQIISSYYKHYCIDACESRNTFTTYYTCTTDLGWDYCSPEEGKDWYNRRCSEGTYCKLHRDSTYRCPVNGRLQYCSIKRESKEIASSGYYCTSECLFDTSVGRFQCSTADGNSGFCSPDIDVDSHGRVCDNSQCVKRDGNYQCKYDSSPDLYDDCGTFSLNNEPVCHAKRRRKRVPTTQSPYEMVHSVPNSGSNLETRWTMEAANTYANRVSSKERKAASSLIEQLEQIDGGARTLKNPRGSPVRIDLQGTFSRNGRHYRNVQVQQNRQGGSGVSSRTTIATALVECNPQGSVDIPIHYVRDALLRSLRDCDTVNSCTNNYGRTCRLEVQPRSGK